MAGGRFDKLVGKTRPGVYINVNSAREQGINISGVRGVAVVPINKSTYGPAKKFIEISNVAPDAHYAELGYSVFDTDANRQMLLVREALKHAEKVLVYITSEGTKATATIGTLTATAKFGGTRGNKFTVVVAANVVEGFDVTVLLDGNTVSKYDGLKTVAELIEQECPYVTFSGTGNLTANAGTNLTGGTDATAQNSDFTAFLDALEGVAFNTVALPITEESLVTAATIKVKYMRENIGKGVQFVLPNVKSDYEGIISVANAYAIGDTELTVAEATAWVAGAEAGARFTESLTYHTVDGATEIVGVKSHEEAIAAIKDGQLFFARNEAGDIVVEYDINTLTTFRNGKDETYSKNRVIRTIDSFCDTIKLNFAPNMYNNDADGWDIMEGIGKSILLEYDNAGAITNVNYGSDFRVDRENSTGDKTYFNVAIQPVDSSEKLFFTVSTR